MRNLIEKIRNLATDSGLDTYDLLQVYKYLFYGFPRRSGTQILLDSPQSDLAQAVRVLTMKECKEENEIWDTWEFMLKETENKTIKWD